VRDSLASGVYDSDGVEGEEDDDDGNRIDELSFPGG